LANPAFRKEPPDMGEKKKTHVPLPKETKAFICANCGAVSLDQHGICKVQGMGRKADWCGTKYVDRADFCHNRVHNLRFRCKNCGQLSVNPELLCEPEQLEMPKK
jgi:predicted RNA-binding Zn-ribbon protein involved in translation (DUF1610 family)